MRGHGTHWVLLGMAAFSVAGLFVAAIGVTLTFNRAHVDYVSNNDIPNMLHGLEAYHRQTGRYPSEAEGLRALVDRQILDKVPRDPWGREYRYMFDGKPVLTSYGEDGRPGGDDLDTDISSNDLK